MPKVVTDQKEFSISIIQHGNAEILNFSAPTEVESGEEFVIEYDVINNGITDTLYGEIVLDDQSILEGSIWEEVVPADETVHKSVTVPGITAPMVDNVLTVGHM